MDTTMLKEKMLHMAKMMNFSPETIKALESDPLTPTKSSVTVAVVKPTDIVTENKTTETEDGECKPMSDEEVDKMTEQEAKDYIKKMQKEEEMPTTNPKPTSRIMDAKVM